MTNAKTTKRALLASVFSLLICVSMLIGSTFAWFTDTATTGVNTIVAGNLDIALYNGTVSNGAISYSSVVDGETKLFDEAALWEPGHTEVAYLKIENTGSLSLRYQMTVNVLNEVVGTNEAGGAIKLSKILKFDVVEIGATEFYKTRKDAIAAATNAGNLQTTTESGVMFAEEAAKYLALIVYMPTDVGNEANYRGTTVPSIQLGVNLIATQNPNESDSFGNTYDDQADGSPDYEWGVIKSDKVTADVSEDESVTYTVLETPNGDVKATVPDEALAEDATEITLTVDEKETPTSVNTAAIVGEAFAYDIEITGIDESNTTVIPVEIAVGSDLTVNAVYHQGVAMTAADTGAADTYSYNATTGVLTIYITHCSEFVIDISVNAATPVNNAEELVKAIENGEDVILNAAIALSSSVVIAEGSDITFDLNGYELTAAAGVFAIENNGTLTVTDSVGTGVISARIGVDNYGALVLNSGSIVATEQGGAAIYNNENSNATFVMNGGELSATFVGTYADSTGGACIRNKAGCKTVITKGTLNSRSARTYAIISDGELEITPEYEGAVTMTAYRGIAIDDGTAIINGGDFTVLNANEAEGKYVAYESYYALYIGGGEAVTVNGGNFIAPDQSVWNPTWTETPLTINGGYFNTSMTGVDDYHTNKMITIYGGTFAVEPAEEYIAQGYAATQSGDGMYIVSEAK